jgi:beta-glucanase (GH16 family)
MPRSRVVGFPLPSAGDSTRARTRRRRGSACRLWLSSLAVGGVVLVAACAPVMSSGPVAVKATVPGWSKSKSETAAAGYSGDPGAGWALTWSDDFTGSSSLNDWTFLTGGTGWGNKELQYYDSRNASLAPGGGLVITAERNGYGQECWYGSCTYSGARLQTEGRFEQEYGLIEARIKLPSGTGLWPSFWMEGADINQVSWPASGEIDVIEVNNQHKDLVEAFAHAPDENYGAYYTLPDALSAGYHVFGIDWTASGITWLVDGHAYGHIKAYPGWPFSQPFFLILDLAVGGVWPGSPTASTTFPASMDVSWIRVYQQK